MSRQVGDMHLKPTVAELPDLSPNQIHIESHSKMALKINNELGQDSAQAHIDEQRTFPSQLDASRPRTTAAASLQKSAGLPCEKPVAFAVESRSFQCSCCCWPSYTAGLLRVSIRSRYVRSGD